MKSSNPPHSSIPAIIAIAMALLVSGCAMIGDLPTTIPSSTGDGLHSVLKPLEPGGDTVGVEVMFVERPADDPLWGSPLWMDVDQIGALSPHRREQLEQDGIRIGISSSRPSPALQKMIGLAEEIGIQEDEKKFSGRRLVLRSGGTTELQTTPIFPEMFAQVSNDEAAEPELFTNARGMLQVQCRSLQAGWAELEFLPQIHHGAEQLRHVATDSGWNMRSSQKVRRLYDDRFELTLNDGEMALITATDDPGDSAGARFFLHDSDQGLMRRLIIVRLAGVHTSN
ncbi:hypothetical protein [Calycomorphotria hydatis]|uniref:Uncharacterized protein n=1 Tax=Calycomorphotria hydatis TaxID=2528027 RepID=A0A517TDG8_9PLAN|nr:hypothetical protein [Calycomorphotria hydatis]QDT66411.1 hypothetical protein V22_36780 [Calycomorphotria hydatis]